VESKTVWTYQLVKDQLHLLDTQLTELSKRRSEVAKHCTHEELEQSVEHYYCMACGSMVGDVPEIHPSYYEGKKTWQWWENDIEHDSEPMTYEEAVGATVILPDDPRIKHIERTLDGKWTTES